MKKLLFCWLIILLLLMGITYAFAWSDDAFIKTGIWHEDIIKSFSYYFFWVLPYWWSIILMGTVVLGTIIFLITKYFMFIVRKSQSGMKNYIASMISTLILFISSFIPVLYVLVLSTNSVIIQTFFPITQNSENAMYAINAIISLIMLIAFYFSKNAFQKYASLMGLVLFVSPLLLYSMGESAGSNYYFFPFLITSAFISFVSFTIESIKNNTSIKKQKT